MSTPIGDRSVEGNARGIRRPNDRFTMLANDFIRDAALRPAAFRVACYILSHDTAWQVSQGSIARALGLDAGTVRKAFVELEDADYLRRIPQHSADGRSADLLVVSHERLTEDEWADELASLSGQSPTGETPHGESPSGKTPERKKTNSSEDQVKDPSPADADGALFDAPKPVKSPSPKPVVYSEAFEDAWAAYGRKGAKRTAWAEWQRALTRADVEVIVAGIPPYLANKPDAQYRKDFERWLKGDVWESADATPPNAAPARGTMTLEQADDWLAEQYRAGNVDAVATRTGRAYSPPPNFSTTHDKVGAEFLAADQRDWIKRNRVGLRRVLMGQAFSNGTEVQS